MKPTRFLLLLSCLIAISFGVRLAEIVSGVSALMPVAMAEDKVITEDSIDSSIIVDDTKKEDAHEEIDGEGGVPEIDPPLWLDAGDTSLQNPALQMELLEELSDKRKMLDAREDELAMREAVLQASQKELEQKYQELTVLKQEIQGLLGEQSEQEKARIESLVKVYEAMKAKDAARIFDTLDIDVLVAVMSQMSERRLSPILANMNPERARTVTIILAEQKKLPELPQN